MIAFPPFEPDRMKYASAASTNVTNCLPTADGWGPMPDIAVISLALDEPCLGGVSIRTSGGAYRIIVGSTTKLWEYNSTTLDWVDISRVAGGAYAVPDGDEWSFAVFGTNLMAVQLGDDPQYIDIDSGANFAVVTGSPPRAKFAITAGSQIVLLHHVDFPNRVMTSGVGDMFYWTPGRRGCDFQDFPDGEEITGGKGAQSGALIIQRTKMRSLTLGQGETNFRTDVINDERGVAAPLSIGWIGPGQFVYLSVDGFFSGVEGKPIGIERVDEWFRSVLDGDGLETVKALVDPLRKVVWWRFLTTSGTSRMVGYKWPLDRWCYSDAEITQILALVTPGITIDGLDAFYATIDDITIPFDSALFTGGTHITAIFNADDKLGYLSGPPMAAELDTPDTQLIVGKRTWLSEARIIGDAVNATLQVITSNSHGGGRTTGTAVSRHEFNGIYPFRSSALMHAFKVVIPAGEAWTHISAIDFPEGGFIPEGSK